MLRHEIKKLYIKQSGLLLFVLFVIAEIILLNARYPEKQFANDNTSHYYYAYMDEFSGKLTVEKEEKILSEQEIILNAQNSESLIMRKLWYNEYSSESEFLADLAPVSEVVRRSQAFNLLYTDYGYAKESPENRYIMRYDYKGMTSDFPDIMLTVLVVLGTALLFINEESSRMITFIRITENGMAKTLFAKYVSLVIFIGSAHLFGTTSELLFMLFRGNANELLYPLQSIAFFGNCPYEISILGGFLCISAIRFLGYLFLSSFVILLSVILKNPLLTVFIPSAVCILQQFLFSPATPAYYLPTGLLRAVGYYRGNSDETINKNTALSETVRDFTEIPLFHLILMLSTTALFIIATAVIVRRYYEGAKIRPQTRKTAALLSLFIVALFSGCNTEKTNDVIFNAGEAMFFAQDENRYYVSDNTGITAVSKSDGTSTKLITDAFSFNEKKDCRLALCKDYLYYHDHNRFDNSIVKVSLSELTAEAICSESDKETGFLGLSAGKSPEGLSGEMILSFFSDGSNVYIITYAGDGVYRLNGNKLECVVSETLYDTGKVCFDGRKIYYINRQLKLKAYDVVTGVVDEISVDFTKTVYYDGTRILYSNMNGIFAINPDNNTTKLLSEERADEITSDGENVVILQENALYLLGDEKTMILDYEPECFAIISQTKKLFVRDTYSDDNYLLIDLPF